MNHRDGLPRFSVSGLYQLNCTHTTTSGSLATPPFGSLFPSPLGSRVRPPHTLSGGHPPVAPRGVGKA